MKISSIYYGFFSHVVQRVQINAKQIVRHGQIGAIALLHVAVVTKPKLELAQHFGDKLIAPSLIQSRY